MPYTSYDCRFARPNPVTRSGLNVYVRVEFYAYYTTAGIEVGCYNSANQRISNPLFTQNYQALQWVSNSAVWMGSYWKYQYNTLTYTFINSTLAAMTTSIRVWAYANSVQIDQFPP
jgi:hypothetical protein